MPTDRQKPVLLKYRSSKWLILATVCMASFSDAFIYGVVVPVLPFSLRERSGVDEDHIQFWNSMLLAAFGGVQFIGSPIFGWLADRTSSRRGPLLLGLILNAGATSLLCFATNVYSLLLSRALQGLSAAIVYTVGFALLSDTIGPENLGEWMGYIILSVNVGMTMAPTVGGVMYDNAGYYSLFIVVFSLIALDILMRLVMVEKKLAVRWIEEDASTSNNPSTRYGTLDSGPNESVSQPENVASQSATLSSSESAERSNTAGTDPSASLIKTENLCNEAGSCSPSYPLLLVLLSSARVWADLYGAFVAVTLLVSFDSALPLFAERTFDWGSTGGGLLFFTITLPILGAPLAGKFTDRYQTCWLSTTGFVLVGGFTTLLQLVTYDSTNQVILLCSLLTLNGCARVISASPLGADLSRAVQSMEKKRPGIFGRSGASAQVFSLYTSASAAGVLVGPVWTSYAYGERNWTFLVSSLGILCASVAVPLGFFSGPREHSHNGQPPSNAV